MPPEVEHDEVQLARAREDLRRGEERRDVSKLVFGVTMATAASVIIAVITATWYLAKWDGENRRNADKQADAMAALSSGMASLNAALNGPDRWKVPHQAQFASELQRELRMQNVPVVVPDPYDIKRRVGQ